MRFVLCGKNDAAVDALEFLVEQGDEVWAIANRGDDGVDGWQRSLRAAADRLEVPLDQPGNVNDPGFVERLAAFEPTALISVQYDQILKANLIRGIGAPCVNFHFALLPRHRGVAPIAWAILANDAETGVTAHHMVEAIDAGDVIEQVKVPIGAADSARAVYDNATAASLELFRRCYPFSDEVLSRRRPQIASDAVYHRNGELDFSQKRVNWDRPGDELHRWIRAMIFPPLQYPEFVWEGRSLWITEVDGELRAGDGQPAGVVVDRSEQTLDVATRDRVLRIRGLCDGADPGRPSQALIQSIPLGGRLT